MHFKNPEILYFLWLLIIPILVHLFQLQKFVKVPFTNVAFLQKIIQDSRQSSRIKKWLLLATRMLFLLAILFAFSQPYFSDFKNNKKQHISIYLDNSLSTIAKGDKGILSQIASKEIIENAPKTGTFSLITNDDFYENISYTELKNKLLFVKNSSTKQSISSILLKLESFQKNKTNTLYNNILISDFQNNNSNQFTNVTPYFSLLKLSETQKNNISIDSVFTSIGSSNDSQLNVRIKNQGNTKNNIPIALYDGTTLISKQSFSIDENSEKTIPFTIQKKDILKGKISISFSDTFSFDNVFYFTKKTAKKIRVLAIGNEVDFLSKIYTEDEFNFTQNSSENINYNILQKQDLIIIHEVEKISEILSKSLQEFNAKNGAIVCIPNSNGAIDSYNNFLQKIATAKLSSKISDSLKITTINEKHPFFQNVFSEKVDNFQYPEVNHFYQLSAKNESKIVGFENNESFISQLKTNAGNLYVFASAINKKNSSFQNSPLIVPIFYNFGKFSFQQSQLYYYLDDENKIDIDIQLQKDAILEMANAKLSFIPQQQTFQNKVTITTKEQPKEAGFYDIKTNGKSIEILAFNAPKEESSLQFLEMLSLKKSNPNITVSDSIADVFSNIYKKNEVQSLWKWFLALAIVSLLLEILILKFYKP